MERAPPPSLATAALAAMDEALMDTPLSPKRPRQDDPPQPGGHKSHRDTPTHHHKQRAQGRHAYKVAFRQSKEDQVIFFFNQRCMFSFSTSLQGIIK